MIYRTDRAVDTIKVLEKRDTIIVVPISINHIWYWDACVDKPGLDLKDGVQIHVIL